MIINIPHIQMRQRQRQPKNHKYGYHDITTDAFIGAYTKIKDHSRLP